MTDAQRKPDLYYEALADYRQFTLKAESYLLENFQDPVEIKNSERLMIRALRAEYRRLLVLKIFRTDVERETLKLIRFFFIRERRQDVKLRNYSSYLLGFMQKNRKKMIKPWNPGSDLTFDEVIREMVSRIATPWDDVNPVLNEWIPKKMREAAGVIPSDILAKGGIGKIFRVIAGVFLYTLTDLNSDTPVEEAKHRLEIALKSGYFFGLLHPLVDDILDSANHLTPAGKREVLRLMDHWIGGDFDMPDSLSEHKTVAAIKRALQELYSLFPPDKLKELVKYSYCLHFAQMEDMQKETGTEISLPGIYVPVLLKAAFTRFISCWFSGTDLSPKLTNDVLETGLVFQLMDDFRDLLPDLREGCFTPFTHFVNAPHEEQSNPWLIYLRAVDLFIKKSPDHTVSRKALIRRVAISIQNCSADEDPGQSLPYLKQIFSSSPGSFRYVKKILKLRPKMVDPDKSLFEPVDWYFK